jgi:hypothetical protein
VACQALRSGVTSAVKPGVDLLNISRLKMLRVYRRDAKTASRRLVCSDAH